MLVRVDVDEARASRDQWDFESAEG
jgi:hypothetical protein